MFFKLITNSPISSIFFAILLLSSVSLITNNAFAQADSGEDMESTKTEEKRQELEEKRKEHQEKIEKKQLKKSKQLQEKLQKLKEKYQNKLTELSLDNLEKSQKIETLEKTFHEKSKKILDRLEAKSDKLNLRTQKLIEKINDGMYMGKKITSSAISANYSLVFDSVSASKIGEKPQTSTLIGSMNFSTFDSSETNLKLKLEECQIFVDTVPYSCGFGKARTASFDDSGIKDSLVIIAFLEDNLSNEVHTSLKIFLKSDMPINQTEESKVIILGPQSKISHLWFLNGTGTLNKISDANEITDDVDDSNRGKDFTIELKENISVSAK